MNSRHAGGDPALARELLVIVVLKLVALGALWLAFGAGHPTPGPLPLAQETGHAR